MKRLSFHLLSALLATSFATHSLAESVKVAQQPPTQERAQTSIQDMDALFNGSWASKVSSSSNQEVSKLMQQAEQARDAARQALDSSDYASAISKATEAKEGFLKAASKARPVKPKAERQKEEYQSRLGNVETLIEAYKQAEQDATDNNKENFNNLLSMVDTAKTAASQNNYEQANDLLNKADIAFKAIITSVMQGSTVTAEKDTSPKGIYAYEIFRNDTYKALIDMLIEQKLDITQDPGFIADTQQGDKIRREAAAIGDREDYPAATERMIESTNAYKGAVRLSGIPITD